MQPCASSSPNSGRSPTLAPTHSHETFRDLFLLLKPSALIDITAAWAGQLEGPQVCIDGKVSHGAKDPTTGRRRRHLLRAWVSESGLSAGQIACADKTNELSTPPALLASLQLKNSLKGKRKRTCLSHAFRSEIIAATFKIP